MRLINEVGIAEGGPRCVGVGKFHLLVKRLVPVKDGGTRGVR